MEAQRFILSQDNPQPLSNLIDWIADRNIEKVWSVEIKEYKKNRSQEQNAYYWGAVLPTIQAYIRDSRGENYSTDDIHEWYRDEFLPKRTIVIKGVTKVTRPSTAKLNTKKFADYLELVMHHCAENGIVIPPAQERVCNEEASKQG